MLTEQQQAELDWNQQMVTALRAAMLGQASDGALSLEIKGRALARLTPEQMRRELEICQRRVEQLNRQALGIRRGRTVRVIG